MAETTPQFGELPGYLRRSGFLHGMAILVVLVGVALAWGWLMRVTVTRIDVRGAGHADPTEIVELARVDSGDVMFRIESRLIADRVNRHPWIERTQVTRLPTGRFLITVRERTPIVRVLKASGRPSYYIDSDGYRMPASSVAVFDVPLLSGVSAPYNAVTPIEDADVLELLQALEVRWETGGRFISEIVREGREFWLYLEPTGLHDSMPVRLGRGDFGPKLGRLAAFWENRVLPGQNQVFELIDLRFSSQIITREHERE